MNTAQGTIMMDHCVCPIVSCQSVKSDQAVSLQWHEVVLPFWLYQILFKLYVLFFILIQIVDLLFLKKQSSAVNNRRGKKNLVMSAWGDDSMLSEEYVNPYYVPDDYQSYSEQTRQNLVSVSEM